MADFKIKNIKDAARQIQKELLEKIQNDTLKYQNEITEEAQKAVEDLSVVDTRNLKANTNGKVFTTSTAAVFRFQTVGVPYAENPYYGFGSSERYGPRKWLELARSRYAKKLGLKGFKTAGGFGKKVGSTVNSKIGFEGFRDTTIKGQKAIRITSFGMKGEMKTIVKKIKTPSKKVNKK